MPGLIASKKYIVIFINICELDFPQQAVALNALDTLRDNNIRYIQKHPLDVFEKSFEISTEKHLCWSFFLIKLQTSRSGL